MIRLTDSLSFYKFDLGSSSSTIQQGQKQDEATSQSTQNIGVILFIKCCICKLNDLFCKIIII